jgi:hypothetical protein
MSATLLVAKEWKFGTHTLRPGTELTISDIRGRVRFVQYVANLDTGAEWIDVIGTHARSVRPERIKVVHRTTRLP